MIKYLVITKGKRGISNPAISPGCKIVQLAFNQLFPNSLNLHQLFFLPCVIGQPLPGKVFLCHQNNKWQHPER